MSSPSSDTLNQPPGGPVAVGVPPSLSRIRSPQGYEIINELGRGAFGVVYQARQISLNRTVALKMMIAGGHASKKELDRFRKEAETVARLQHPLIVQIFDFGELDGMPYIVMEYMAGGSLADRLTKGPLKPPNAAAVMKSLAKTLATVHDAGIVHRDLKPANLLMAADNILKIADFGLARDYAEGGINVSSAGAGTPLYRAPEQTDGRLKDIGPPADIYALGAIIYECLTGQAPFADDATKFLLRSLTEEPTPVRETCPEAPVAFAHVVMRCLAKDPKNRFGDGKALAGALGLPQAKPDANAKIPQKESVRGDSTESRPIRPSDAKVASEVETSNKTSTEPNQTAFANIDFTRAAAAKRPPTTAPRRLPNFVRYAIGLFGVIALTVGVLFAVMGRRPSGNEIALDLGGGVTMEFALIPPGSFTMGSNDGDSDEKPPHTVRITKAFYLAKQEVTQAQYEQLMGSNPSYFSAGGEGKDSVKDMDTRAFPVECVSWTDAVAFCDKLTTKDRQSRTCRLPTDAEWEYACRAGSKAAYHFGDSMNGTQANYDGTNLKRTCPVGSYATNDFGLYDMHGNLWEWCLDGKRTYKVQAETDPIGPTDSGSVRVYRGGCWSSLPGGCRSAIRDGTSPSIRGNGLGFRPALVP